MVQNYITAAAIQKKNSGLFVKLKLYRELIVVGNVQARHSRQNDIGSVYFVSWGQTESVDRVILPLAKHDWLKWSHGRFETHDLLS